MDLPLERKETELVEGRTTDEVFDFIEGATIHRAVEKKEDITIIRTANGVMALCYDGAIKFSIV